MPDLKGKTQADAEKALADLKLVGVASNPEETTEVNPGLVFKQSIAAGTVVKEGERVAFTVALAPAEVTVPDVVGKTRDEAKKAITDAKLGFDYTTAYDGAVTEGKVISQSVAANTKIKSGSTVSVVVSLGAKPPVEITVPDVLTYSWPEAQATLESAGLDAKFVGDEDGIVVSQSIPAGTVVADDTTVTVHLENGKEDTQNPVMNYVGNYQSGRATLSVDAVGANEALIVIDWALDASTSSQWSMMGTFDEATSTVTYTNGNLITYTYNDKGKVVSEDIAYTDGKGAFTFSGNKITWDDKTGHVADGMTFKHV